MHKSKCDFSCFSKEISYYESVKDGFSFRKYVGRSCGSIAFTYDNVSRETMAVGS